MIITFLPEMLEPKETYRYFKNIFVKYLILPKEGKFALKSLLILKFCIGSKSKYFGFTKLSSHKHPSHLKFVIKYQYIKSVNSAATKFNSYYGTLIHHSSLAYLKASNLPHSQSLKSPFPNAFCIDFRDGFCYENVLFFIFVHFFN